MSKKIKGGVALAKRPSPAKTELEPPPLYQVLLINDDYTPMDFVVIVLQKYFSLSLEMAIEKMLQVHNAGRAVCGIFSRDIAETKVCMVNDFSRVRDYPLLCTMEAVIDE
jgi:ATP-dependent Clp protease adaptor protein ClpS